MSKVIIVGAGIGGLSMAARLLAKGYEVIIFEKEDKVGGKVNSLEENGFKFDLTASVAINGNCYSELFSDIHKNYSDYFEMENLESTYKVFFEDSKCYEFYSNYEKMFNALENISEGLGKEYFDFIDKSLEKYFLSKDYFLDKPMITMGEFLNLNILGKLKELNPLESCGKYIQESISNELLQKFLIFQSMYIGINPYTNSNVYSLIPAISQNYGFSYIKGGLYSYIFALEKVIADLGGEIKKNLSVDEIFIEEEKASGVKVGEKIYKSDFVLCNVDYPYAIKNLINVGKKELGYNKKNLDKKEYSCSVFMIYLGLNKVFDSLNVHNIYLNKDFQVNLESAFKGNLPKKPSLYIYYPSAIDRSLTKEGYSTMNIMVRVPNLSYKEVSWGEDDVKKIRKIVIEALKNMKGLDNIENSIIYENHLTPVDIEKRFNSYYGTAFGLSHKLTQSMYMRPHMKSKSIDNLYFLGSSTHPGNGVSVIIEGSKILADLIEKEQLF
ncbi:MAG: phytoene desaturase family protein [Sarcina sp.]